MKQILLALILATSTATPGIIDTLEQQLVDERAIDSLVVIHKKVLPPQDMESRCL